MAKLQRVKQDGTPDNRYLERDELERELVRKDKQALISDALKIFDTNTMLFEQVEAAKGNNKILDKMLRDLGKEIDRLKARTLWSILNERIQWRINKMRKRRTETNYSTP
ncbi:unnamed protein product [marine sediment metagenome]|uniref:Uncharacterized protein n=1 Tax=marine sediment metagenome TaxID=412755 RepID=X1DS86_9ZZZZ